MRNIFTDKYFTKSKEVAKNAGLNPIVKYRVFSREQGIAALKPACMLIRRLCPSAEIEVLPEGTPFEPHETLMIITAPFQDIVELEPMYLWWSILPSVCARHAAEMTRLAPDKDILDFSNRHSFGAECAALVSYGASVGGIKKSSYDIGNNPLKYLKVILDMYEVLLAVPLKAIPDTAIGTTPHALLAIFRGDYRKMAEAYIDTFPDDNFTALIDYNNREIDDSLRLLRVLGDKLYGVRIDTCKENMAQRYPGEMPEPQGLWDYGVTVDAVEALSKQLKLNGGQHVKIAVSSGFDAKKIKEFESLIPSHFDVIGTGSFIKFPTATADIFSVDGETECKVGRQWGLRMNKDFDAKKEVYND